MPPRRMGLQGPREMQISRRCFKLRSFRRILFLIALFEQLQENSKRLAVSFSLQRRRGRPLRLLDSAYLTIPLTPVTMLGPSLYSSGLTKMVFLSFHGYTGSRGQSEAHKVCFGQMARSLECLLATLTSCQKTIFIGDKPYDIRPLRASDHLVFLLLAASDYIQI